MDTLKNAVLIVMLVISSYLSVGASNSKKEIDTLPGLHLKGRVVKTSGPASDLCKVELFLNGKVIDSLFISDSRVFDLKLVRNNTYTIRIAKKNHVAKLVVVNTEFPDEINDLLEFSFKTDLMSTRAADDLNKDALDFPAAIIHFEPKHELFVYNEAYTREIKREIYSQPDKNKLVANASKSN